MRGALLRQLLAACFGRRALLRQLGGPGLLSRGALLGDGLLLGGALLGMRPPGRLCGGALLRQARGDFLLSGGALLRGCLLLGGPLLGLLVSGSFRRGAMLRQPGGHLLLPRRALLGLLLPHGFGCRGALLRQFLGGLVAGGRIGVRRQRHPRLAMLPGFLRTPTRQIGEIGSARRARAWRRAPDAGQAAGSPLSPPAPRPASGATRRAPWARPAGPPEPPPSPRGQGAARERAGRNSAGPASAVAPARPRPAGGCAPGSGRSWRGIAARRRDSRRNRRTGNRRRRQRGDRGLPQRPIRHPHEGRHHRRRGEQDPRRHDRRGRPVQEALLQHQRRRLRPCRGGSASPSSPG